MKIFLFPLLLAEQVHNLFDVLAIFSIRDQYGIRSFNNDSIFNAYGTD